MSIAWPNNKMTPKAEPSHRNRTVHRIISWRVAILQSQGDHTGKQTGRFPLDLVLGSKGEEREGQRLTVLILIVLCASYY